MLLKYTLCFIVLNKFHQFFFVQVRHRPKRHPGFRPMDYIVTLNGRRRGGFGILFIYWPDDKIDDVFVAMENKRGHAASADVIKPAADERKSLCRQIFDWWREV